MSIIRFVAFTLGYTNPRKAIQDHTKGVTNRSSLIAGDNQEMTLFPKVTCIISFPTADSHWWSASSAGDLVMCSHVCPARDPCWQSSQTHRTNRNENRLQSVLSDSARRQTSHVQWQRKHSNAEIVNSGLDRRQKGQSYICQTTKSKPHSPPIAAMRFFTVG